MRATHTGFSVTLVGLIVVTSLIALHEASLPCAFGDVPVLQQLPLQNDPPAGAPFSGHDQFSTVVPAVGATGAEVLDNFEVSVSRKLTSITWWGAPLQPQAAEPHEFFVQVYDNVPANGNVPSHPGNTVAFASIAAPGFGDPGEPLYTSTQVSDPGSPAGLLMEYSGALSPFFQFQANTPYWLTIYTSPDFTQLGLTWGWHTRDYTIPDPLSPVDSLVGMVGGLPVNQSGSGAVSQGYIGNSNGFPVLQGSPTPLSYSAGTDGPAGIDAFGMNMAFALYNAPEPSSLILGALGAIALLAYRRRR
jgi:hypothetical protein